MVSLGFPSAICLKSAGKTSTCSRSLQPGQGAVPPWYKTDSGTGLWQLVQRTVWAFFARVAPASAGWGRDGVWLVATPIMEAAGADNVGGLSAGSGLT